MDTVFAIFALGLAVTLVVAKGMMQASEFAKKELDKIDSKESEDQIDSLRN